MRGVTSARRVVIGIGLILAVACGSGGQDATTLDSPSITQNVLTRLVDPLDDPGHYCIDVVGFGSGARFRDALQAHTCKAADNRDQQFTQRTQTGQLYMEEYRLCLQPENLAPGSELYLRECSDSPLQSFDFFGDGTIRVGEAGPGQLCLAVAPGDGEVINPIHMRRDLSIEACDATEPNLMEWLLSAESPERN